MAEGRCIALWHHTSALLALLTNIHRDPKKSHRVRPLDFHPFARVLRREAPKSNVSVAALADDIMSLVDAGRGRGAR